MSKRVCIVGTPRSGSQYVSRLVSNAIQHRYHMHVYNMIEPLTITAHHRPVLDPLARTLHHEEGLPLDTFPEYSDRVSYFIDTIKKCKGGVPLVLKIFPFPYMFPYLPTIVEVLKDCDFKFIALKRKDIESQLISWAIANHHQRFNAFTENEIFNSSDAVQLDNPYDGLNWLYETIRDFDKTCNEFGLSNLPTVYYETAKEDLSNILKLYIPDQVDILKQIKSDPYNLIKNREEVETIIKGLINGN